MTPGDLDLSNCIVLQGKSIFSWGERARMTPGDPHVTLTWIEVCDVIRMECVPDGPPGDLDLSRQREKPKSIFRVYRSHRIHLLGRY